jgi:hypothetical protein
MNDAKYIGLDVRQATTSAAVLDWTGKLVMECVLETKAITIFQFIHGLRGTLQVTFEEGTCAAWLHDLLTITTPDSLHRPDSSGSADRADPDASSFPHQAATLGLQRSGLGDSNQCRVPFPGWATPAFQKTAGHAWAQCIRATVFLWFRMLCSLAYTLVPGRVESPGTGRFQATAERSSGFSLLRG